MAYRDRHVARGVVRPPSAPPNAGTKRKERDYEQDSGDETNIHVVVRCRGRNDREVRENSGVVVSTTGVKSKNVELCMGPNAIGNKTYHFDKVFSPAADQMIVFEDVVSPILSEMLSGFNCTIFAYGQTGTGKTYTMSGDMTDTMGLLSDAAGIIPRVLYSIFQKLEAEGTECSVKISFIELYNEELRDLLSADDSVKLKIYDDSSKKSHSTTIVQGMEETHIKSAAEGIKRLQEGSHRRQVAATKCNDLSSRSHTVFTITTYTKKPGENSEDYICSGKLNLVDLAGSENIQRSGAENKRAAEAGLINKSLLTLGRVINALVDKSAHIPYRESKLTRLLQDSLGGRTKTCIIATISPAKSNLEETISTLDYAFRAKNIRNKPQVNSLISKKTLLKEFTAEIEKLKSELIATRQRNGVYLTNEQFEDITVESESRRILSEEQKARIETMEISLRSKVQDLFNLTNNFTTLKKDNEATRLTLDNTKDILEKTEFVLNNTRQNLEEEMILRKKHQVTEEQLRTVGTELISTIGSSVQDLNKVHAKLRRTSDVHRCNQETWSASTSQVWDVSQTVDKRLEQLKEQHATSIEELSSRVEMFVTDEIQRALQGRATVQKCVLELDNYSDAIKRHSSDARHEMNEVLEEIKVLREDVKAKVGIGLNGLSDAAARIAGEVIVELEEFHTQLHTSYSGLGRDFKHFFEETTKELIAQREESDRLRGELQKANHLQLEKALAASDQLERCIEDERQAAEGERIEMVRQFTTLLEQSEIRRAQRLSGSLINTKSGLVQSAEDFEGANRSYKDGMEAWNTRDTALLKRVTQSKEDLKIKMKNDWTAIESRNGAIQSSTKAVHEETIKIVDAQLQAMTTQMAALDDFVKKARQQNNSNYDAHAARITNMSSQLGSAFAKLDDSLSNEAVNAFDTEIQGQKSLLTDSLVELANQVRQPLQNLTTHFTTTELEACLPTGETPAKRIWSYPTNLPRTSTGHTPPPKTTIATPGPKTKTPNHARSKSQSPRKMVSPRKHQIKNIYVDTPPAKRAAMRTDNTSIPAAIPRTDSTQSLPTQSQSSPDVSTNLNQSISIPITGTTTTSDNQLETHPKLKEDSSTTTTTAAPVLLNSIKIPITNTTSANLGTTTRVPQLRNTRSTTTGKNGLAMSIGPSIVTTIDSTNYKEKENIPHQLHHGGTANSSNNTTDIVADKLAARPATAIGYSSTNSLMGGNGGLNGGVAPASAIGGRRLRSSPPQ